MDRSSNPPAPDVARAHPRTIGWIGTTALAMGGSNQSLFLMGALILGQGSAAVPLLILGLLLSWVAAFGWTELILMWPNRVGGIAATCAEAFRPYSPVLANLTGVCYWWGWVPTCGLTAILSATAIVDWYLPGVPVPLLATLLVLFFTAVNLCGVKWVTRLAVPIATASAFLAFLSGLIPVLTGHVNWHQATTYHLLAPFHGLFGHLTGAMAGLYLIGFAAPAFEAATCHVGETVDPTRNVPRAMLASAVMAGVYFVALPVIWLGVLGPTPLTGDLAQTLGPTFTPLLGSVGRAAAIWFMMFNMFHGTLQPLAGAARTLMQLAEDGLLPRFLAWRNRADTPWVATALTAGMAILFLLGGDPVWVIAAANLCYLIGIALPNVAVWLLRKDAPDMARPYRAPRGTIVLGLIAAGTWGLSTILGFQQFGLPTVLVSMALAYSGSALYAWRRWSDRRRARVRAPFWRSLHFKLTGAMLLVLSLDGAGYLLAVHHANRSDVALVTVLEDIFVAVALLTISVGLVPPGMIGHAVSEVASAADHLATGTLADLSRAMHALSVGDLNAALARADVVPVVVHSRDEVGAMAASFNTMQAEVAATARALDGARDGLRQARDALLVSKDEAEQANHAKSEFLSRMSHELRTPLNAILGFAQLLEMDTRDAEQEESVAHILKAGRHLLGLINEVLDITSIEAGRLDLSLEPVLVRDVVQEAHDMVVPLTQDRAVRVDSTSGPAAACYVQADRQRLVQVLLNLLANAVKYNHVGGTVTLGCEEAAEGRLRLSVQDTGPGIPAEKQARLFTPFDRLDAEQSGVEGTGMGLALSRSLVEAMGGAIGVASVAGQGSTFWVELQQAEEPSAALSAPEGDRMDRAIRQRDSHTILYIEDNLSNLQLTERLLATAPGLTLLSAMQGRQGLDLARAHVPDLILLDVHLPDLPGDEVLRRLRDDPATRAIPVIVLSADATERQKECLAAAGAQAYLTKPLDIRQFRRTVDAMLERKAG